jgi:prepilin-type N-terminal cleavage/methylation domain-containing protein
MSKLCLARDFAYARPSWDDTVRRHEIWSMKKSRGAFTLIELLVVVVIIAILAGLAFPVFSSVQEKARITQDLSNLRQLGIATQTYLNDNDGVLFQVQTVTSWMKSLHPKYLPSWKIFQSPFDSARAPQESDTTAPVSYGLNPNSIGITSDKIARPTAFILIAPAQDSNASKVEFQGLSGTTTVTVLKDASAPGGTAIGGTQSKRTRINALFADLHVDSLTWTAFKTDTGATGDDANYRWAPAGPP